MSKVVLSGREAILVRRLLIQQVKRLRQQQKAFPFTREIQVDLINYAQLLADKFEVWSYRDKLNAEKNETKANHIC